MTETGRARPPADSRADRLAGLFGWIVGNLVWMMLLGLAASSGWSAWRLAQSGVRTTGVVVRLAERGSGSRVTYAPVVEYAAAGRTYTLEGDIASRPPRYHVGQTVPVLRSSLSDTDGNGTPDTLDLKFQRRDLRYVFDGATLAAAQRDGNYTVTGNTSDGCFSGSGSVRILR